MHGTISQLDQASGSGLGVPVLTKTDMRFMMLWVTAVLNANANRLSSAAEIYFWMQKVSMVMTLYSIRQSISVREEVRLCSSPPQEWERIRVVPAQHHGKLVGRLKTIAIVTSPSSARIATVILPPVALRQWLSCE